MYAIQNVVPIIRWERSELNPWMNPSCGSAMVGPIDLDYTSLS